MTAPVVPRVVLPTAPAPIPLRYGLFSAATIIENADPHTLNGIAYQSICNSAADPYPAKMCPDHPKKLPKPTLGYTEADPFALYAADECVLGRDETEARAQLRQRFVTAEQRGVEREIQDGTAGASPRLRDATMLDSATAKWELPIAIGWLEQAISVAWGGVGVIHVPRALVEAVSKHAGIVHSGALASTLQGTTYVFGTGYTGEPPAAANLETDTNLWLYATPPVTIRRGPLVEPASWSTGAFDKTQNTAMLLVERQYVVDWPCEAFAIRTDYVIPNLRDIGK